MLAILNPLRDMTLTAVFLRMTLACLCGGFIGIEREYKRRPAGMRTHILICLGAAVTTLTSQYLSLLMQYHTDIARLGAQVVAGIGFIGAGTIIVTRNQRVKGLTTAAGLWTTAIIGLAIGAGFYEGGFYTTGLILLAELFLSKMEYRLYKSASEIIFYVKYLDKSCLNHVLHLYQENKVRILNIEIFRQAEESEYTSALFTLRMPKGYTIDHLMNDIHKIDGIISVEEL